MLKNWPFSFFMHFTDGQQPDLKFAISHVKILASRLRPPIQDEARRHKVTSLSVTMEVVSNCSQ